VDRAVLPRAASRRGCSSSTWLRSSGPPAALDKLGFARSALLANFLYFLGSLYLLFRLAAALADRAVGWAAVGSYLFSPLGIQYLLRANHEKRLGSRLPGGFWCLHEMPRSRWFGLVSPSSASSLSP